MKPLPAQAIAIYDFHEAILRWLEQLYEIHHHEGELHFDRRRNASPSVAEPCNKASQQLLYQVIRKPSLARVMRFTFVCSADRSHSSHGRFKRQNTTVAQHSPETRSHTPLLFGHSTLRSPNEQEFSALPLVMDVTQICRVAHLCASHQYVRRWSSPIRQSRRLEAPPVVRRNMQR